MINDLKNQVNIFNTRLKLVEVVLMDVFKVKLPLNLTLNNCEAKDDVIIISHSSIPTQIIPESIFGDAELIKKTIEDNIAKESKKKKVYELKWQIDYWMTQTNPEFIAKKLKLIEEMQSELANITKEMP